MKLKPNILSFFPNEFFVYISTHFFGGFIVSINDTCFLKGKKKKKRRASSHHKFFKCCPLHLSTSKICLFYFQSVFCLNLILFIHATIHHNPDYYQLLLSCYSTVAIIFHPSKHWVWTMYTQHSNSDIWKRFYPPSSFKFPIPFHC